MVLNKYVFQVFIFNKIMFLFSVIQTSNVCVCLFFSADLVENFDEASKNEAN